MEGVLRLHRVVSAAAIAGIALGSCPSIGALPSTISTAASETSAYGVLPIGVPVNGFTCDETNQPVPGEVPWANGELLVIPLCGGSSEGVTWLDWTPPSGGAAEVIAAIEDPIPGLAVPAWLYAGGAFNVNDGNLEDALNDQAGIPLRLVMVDSTCDTEPAAGTDPCETGPGTGTNLWVRGASLRTFTIESAHLSGDLTACTTGNGSTGCLIGAFSESAPFTDIDGNPFRADIEWAYATGVTHGCSATLFCPKGSVPRDEMAAFLDRMFEVAPTDEDFFADDDGNSHEPAINRIAAAGITHGCGAAAYCPDGVVSREQMAAFIARAAGLVEGAGRDYFSDDDGRTLEAYDDLVAAAGVSNGCGPWRFCPGAPVLREQMVAFLHRVEEPIAPPPFPAP